MSRFGTQNQISLPRSALTSKAGYTKSNANHDAHLSESTDSQVLPQNELPDLYWSLVHGLKLVAAVLEEGFDNDTMFGAIGGGGSPDSRSTEDDRQQPRALHVESSLAFVRFPVTVL